MSDRAEQARPAAFFDLDRTLLLANSGKLWMQSERRLGRVTILQMILGLYYLLLYRFGLMDIERVMHTALKVVRGQPESMIRERTHTWFRAEVAATAAPGAWSFLEAHRARGDRLVLLTSSSPYASEAAAELFQLDDFLSTVFEVQEGCFTGRVERPICYGEGKVQRAEGYAKTHGIDLDKSYFYTDSTTDLPMLERVGFPVIVQPDPPLRRRAHKRGWPILDWRFVDDPESQVVLDTLKDTHPAA